jgi:hypothetical protein
LDIKGQPQIWNYTPKKKNEFLLPLNSGQNAKNSKRRWEKVPLILKEPILSLRDIFASCKIQTAQWPKEKG